jgi:hypothetical protein
MPERWFGVALVGMHMIQAFKPELRIMRYELTVERFFNSCQNGISYRQAGVRRHAQRASCCQFKSRNYVV